MRYEKSFRVANARTRELYEVTYEVNIKNSYEERMGNDRIAKMIYIKKCVRSLPRKRWTDLVNECLKKKRFGCLAIKENDACMAGVCEGGNVWSVPRG